MCAQAMKSELDAAHAAVEKAEADREQLLQVRRDVAWGVEVLVVVETPPPPPPPSLLLSSRFILGCPLLCVCGIAAGA